MRCSRKTKSLIPSHTSLPRFPNHKQTSPYLSEISSHKSSHHNKKKSHKRQHAQIKDQQSQSSTKEKGHFSIAPSEPRIRSQNRKGNPLMHTPLPKLKQNPKAEPHLAMAACIRRPFTLPRRNLHTTLHATLPHHPGASTTQQPPQTSSTSPSQPTPKITIKTTTEILKPAANSPQSNTLNSIPRAIPTTRPLSLPNHTTNS